MKEKMDFRYETDWIGSEKLELSEKTVPACMVSIFLYSQLVESDDSHNKHNSSCSCLRSIFSGGIRW